MGIFKKMRRSIAILIILLFIGGKVISKSKDANKLAQRFDYDDAHDMKKDLLTGQKDKTGAHYNIYQVTQKGKVNGDIYLNHTRTNTFYKTTYNYSRPNDYIPLPL